MTDGPDKQLGWGRTQALYSITVSGELEGLSEGERIVVSIDHALEAQFADNPAPAITLPPGYLGRVLACDLNGNPSTGSRCIIEIENVSGGEYGYGGGTGVPYTVTRTGVLA